MAERDGAAPGGAADGAVPAGGSTSAGATPAVPPAHPPAQPQSPATSPGPSPATSPVTPAAEPAAAPAPLDRSWGGAARRQPAAVRAAGAVRRQPGARPQTGGPGRPGAATARPHRAREDQTAALKASLAGSEAEAYQLREALDELRQVLDTGPAAAPRPHAPRRGRRSRVWWLAAAAAVVLVVLGALATGLGRDPGAADQAGPGRTAGPAASSSPEASPAPSLRPLPWPGGPVLVPPGLPASGPGVDSPGTDVTVALDPDGRHLDVFERVAFPEPVERLSLTAESVAELSEGFGRRIEVRVEDLQVQLGDVVVPVTTSGRRTYTAALPDGSRATSAILRYRLGAGLVRVPSSPPGRHYGVVTPLSAGASLEARLPVRMRITDRRVVSFTCPTASDSLCGAREGVAWTATLPPASTPVALMQVNLGPSPR